MTFPLWLLGAVTLLLAQAVLVSGPHARLVGAAASLAALAGVALCLVALARKPADPWRTRWDRDWGAVARGWLVGMVVAAGGALLTVLVSLSGLGGRPPVDPGLVWLVTAVLAVAAAGAFAFRRVETERDFHGAAAGLGVSAVWLLGAVLLAVRGASVWAEQGALIWGSLTFLAAGLGLLRSARTQPRRAVVVAGGLAALVLLVVAGVSLQPYLARGPAEQPKPTPTGEP